MGKEHSCEGSMLAAKYVAGEFESRQRLSAFTKTLIAILALLVLGFPVTPATIRTTVAGWAIVVVASLQFVFRRIGLQGRLVPIRTIHEPASTLNQKA